MEYGLIGEKLGHSFSKEIHAKIGDYPYELLELPREKLATFLSDKQFKAINVTIPYKEAALPYLQAISPEAEKIGAVNLIVNRGGALYGYNTDYYGAKRLLERANVQVKGKKALILGSGGTRRTLYAVLSDLGAREILTVSRSAATQNAETQNAETRFSRITYEQAKTLHADAEIIVNATPVGMFPAIDETPLDPDDFPRLCGVADVIYNPLRTRLIEKARARNIPCANGLFMLAAQAVQASAIMRGVPIDETLCESVYRETLSQKRNIVLIGMPTSGKSTVGAILSKLTGKPLFDTDALTEKRLNKSIPEIFAESGEAAFRREESLTVKDVAAKTGCIIATGGGVVLSPENIRLLKKNGKVFFLDRPKELLTAGGGRPLSANAGALEQMYAKRLPLYLAAADCRIVNDSSPESAARKILQNV